jgi:hypothetical protein
MTIENHFFTRRSLSGGVVNSATEIKWANGEKVVYEKSPTIPEECLVNVRRDFDEAKKAGFRQIQISQEKFSVAKNISEFLTEHNIEHSNILNAKTGNMYGSAFVKFVEGVTGDKIAENNPEIAWNNVGSMLARLHQLSTIELAKKIAIDLNVMTDDSWLQNRFRFLIGRFQNLT